MKWRTEEKEFLKENYGTWSMEMLMQHLPDRTACAIHAEARRLGIKPTERRKNYSKYSDDVHKFIEYMYPRRGGRYCAKTLGMKIETVYTIAHRRNAYRRKKTA